jgi:hypothetical protein
MKDARLSVEHLALALFETDQLKAILDASGLP